MPFVNEKLTEDQRNALIARNIPNPIRKGKAIGSYHWTADHEKDLFLIHAGCFHDLPEEEIFVFLYSDKVIFVTLP
jgi:hypothetical protein